MAYSRHMQWLKDHFGSSHVDDGQALLTEIVNRLTDCDLDDQAFHTRAMNEIRTLTKPCTIYGQIVTFAISHRPLIAKVPARLITFEAIRKHALHCKEQREAHQLSLTKVAKRNPDLAKTMGWDGKQRG